MAHFITVPINENGVIFDAGMTAVVAEAVAPIPFGFGDVFVYSHGWSTNADQALDDYNQFSIGLAKQILIAASAQSTALVNPPRNPLGVGIHWPSEITEDPNSPLNAAQLFTFYTMEHRADAVGRNAVYAMLRLMLQQRAGTNLPLRFFLLGHSFGCRVICSALQDLQTDIENGTIPVETGTQFRVVLLEPAFDNDNLAAGDIYGNVSRMENLRMLVSKSSLDEALNTWYVVAGKAANLFKTPAQALGAVGPSQSVVQAFGGATPLSVTQGFVATDVAKYGGRLLVADLSPIHQIRKAQGKGWSGFTGSHSDIYFDEVYYLVLGFLFA